MSRSTQILKILVHAATTVGLLATPYTWAADSDSGTTGSAWKLPRTPNGDPDLQGIWTNATFTTLERPDDVETLELDAQAARAIETKREEFYENYDEPETNEDGDLASGDDPGGYNTFWMDEGTQLASLDGKKRSSIIIDPADGKIPYKLLTQVGMFFNLRSYFKRDHPEQRLLGERCLVGFGSTGGPPMLPVLYNNHYEIVQGADHVVIMVEMNHDARIVRMNSEHPPQTIRPWLGDSIGWWEDDTLVVETTNFHPGQSFRAATKHFIYSSENLKVTERFTRTGPEEIRYHFSMDDPDIYSQIWMGELPLRAATGPIYEYACHEGNYSLPGILAGARKEDADAAASSWWRGWFSAGD